MTLQNIFRRRLYKRPVAAKPADAKSAEGWEMVDGFNDNPSQEHSLLQVTPGPDGKVPKHIPNMLESSLPPYPVVWVYFLAKKYPDTEAQKFYDRFQMVSWKSFGVKPIENWQHLADQWMLNIRSHKPLTPNE